MNVLIVEDESKTARELKRSVEMLREDCVVVGILPSVKATIKWFSEHETPDLILSDIQLADGLSFEIYQRVDVLAPIIFCTAFDQYAIKAFEVNGIDYLLKPIDEEKLAQSLNKYEQMKKIFADEEKGYDRKLEALLKSL